MKNIRPGKGHTTPVLYSAAFLTESPGQEEGGHQDPRWTGLCPLPAVRATGCTRGWRGCLEPSPMYIGHSLESQIAFTGGVHLVRKGTGGAVYGLSLL